MNGAQALVDTFLAGGVEVCFANPGTSEMHFVAALDQRPDMRCVLGLHETVVTGAADGYARMADKPAATLLHLGPGLGNGLANIHNARRARSPMVNVVGEHASAHLAHNAPLTTDIESIARPVSDWVRRAAGSEALARDGAAAVQAARSGAGAIATLILPADAAWGPSPGPAPVPEPPARPVPSMAAIEAAARLLAEGASTILFIGDAALREEGLRLAGQIGAKTGARVMAPLSNKRIARGAGRTPITRTPYVVDIALAHFADARRMVLVGAREPVAFFGYPDKPSRLLPPDCAVTPLADASFDPVETLRLLAEATDATGVQPPTNRYDPPARPVGAIDQDKIAALLAAMIPDQAVIVDESITTGRLFFPATDKAAPHDWLQITGGAIGIGPPLATGAAIGAPGRKVLNLQADGSGLYSAQALWTQAREGLDVITLVFANHSYAILQGEMSQVGVRNPGRNALDMLSLDRPRVDWVSLAKGFGVPGERVGDMEALAAAIGRGLAKDGPHLIEIEM
ncbi:MAG: acetolactate synthase large subunit [Alphaproteobacteria bacterium]|nr:acetolactate synthase large subunit [Alphaproteobacteria bacterium]